MPSDLSLKAAKLKYFYYKCLIKIWLPPFPLPCTPSNSSHIPSFQPLAGHQELIPSDDYYFLIYWNMFGTCVYMISGLTILYWIAN